MPRKKSIKKALSLALLLLMLLLIWGNSALPGEESSQLSGGLTALFQRLFGPVKDLQKFTFILRKLAHMTEFAALAIVLSWFLRQWQAKDHRPVSLPLLCGLGAACVDETIQLFSPGRGSSLRDVWIDMAGFCLGLLLYSLISFLVSKKISRNQK